MAIIPFFKSEDKAFTLLQGDCVELLSQFDFKFDMIFADPPYFLSNDGITVQSGKMVSVNKGAWDKSNGFEKDNEFNYRWLKACRDKLTEKGTIWISGTFHNIFSVAQMLTELDYKILNCITWAKTNPPPNLSCKYFTHSTEFILWARKNKKGSHYFNYELMKEINGGNPNERCVEFAGYCSLGKIVWKTPYPKTFSPVSPDHFSFNAKKRMDS